MHYFTQTLLYSTGTSRIASIICGFIAFIMSAVAVGACNFMKADLSDYVSDVTPKADFYDDVSDVTPSYNYFDYSSGSSSTEYLYTLNFGLFKAAGALGICLDYTGVELSASIKAAQAFGVLSALFGGILMIACFVMLFVKFPRKVCIFIS